LHVALEKSVVVVRDGNGVIGRRRTRRGNPVPPILDRHAAFAARDDRMTMCDGVAHRPVDCRDKRGNDGCAEGGSRAALNLQAA